MGLFSRGWKPSRQASQAPAGPLREFMMTPPPAPSTPLSELPLLAVDVETTGLDARTDSLLSIGWVSVDGAAITLAGAGHRTLRSAAEVGESATFHGITDDALAEGVPPQQALEELLTALRGRVLLAHHAAIETGFLTAACARVWGVGPQFTTVDTMVLQHRLLSKGFDDEPSRGALRLWAARDQFGLPRYSAHEALTDALACAELYLAQSAQLGTGATLKQVS